MTNRWYRGTWEPGTDISPEQTEFATAHRVPFLTSPHPDRKYIVGVVIGDEPFYAGMVPTEEEILVVADFTKNLLDYWFPKPNAYRDEMEHFAPYDIDTAPSRYFIKYRHGGWGYRWGQWSSPLFIPSKSEAPETLQQAIERYRKHYG